MRNRLFQGLLLINSLALSTATIANDLGAGASFKSNDAYTKVQSTIDLLITWAESEYAEHAMEGLWRQHPEEAKVTRATIDIARQLRSSAINAKKSGDLTKAQGYYYAAEATARYAAQMPHMLRERNKN